MSMKLPKLLAGPIIRRVETTKVYIWVAMSELYDIRAEMFDVQNFESHYQYKPLHVNTEIKPIRLGKRLFCYLIEISSPFPIESLIGYNLHFSNSNEKFDFKSLGLLDKDNQNSIVYTPLKYPTLLIRTKNEKILFGSCRKPHGKGEDALATGDLKIKETYFDTSERPGALFLVGDQIYADDVANPIFPFILDLAKELIGFEEDLTKLDSRLVEPHFQKALKQVHSRQFIMEDFCHFSSRKAHNHLITFGEFAAMYLLSLNPELWKSTNKKHIMTFEELVTSLYVDETDKGFLENKTNYQEQLENLQQFIKTLPQVRRLLANIPTYMMFDDHDVTDDWNLSYEWKKNVDNSPLGQHVIANGLAGCWAFQCWGNTPEQFDNEFLQNMQSYMQSYQIHSTSYDSWQKQLLNFKNWSFVAPTHPKALFLDTRTMRSFEPTSKPNPNGKLIKEVASGPQLISPEGWDINSIQLKNSGWKSDSPLILVSPAPFYGIRLIETFLYQYISPLKLLNIPVQTAFDMEFWIFNGKGYHNFHEQISKWNPKNCVILSGDAHMASAVETVVSFQNGQKRKIQQFTCSPMKNDSYSLLTNFFLQGILRLNTFLNGEKELHRFCDSNFSLSFENGDFKSEQNSLWKELIHYLSLPNDSIVETKNNLGLLITEHNEVNVQLLQLKDSHVYDSSFK